MDLTTKNFNFFNKINRRKIFIYYYYYYYYYLILLIILLILWIYIQFLLKQNLIKNLF